MRLADAASITEGGLSRGIRPLRDPPGYHKNLSAFNKVVSKSDNEIDENPDVAPDRRNDDQNGQDNSQNFGLLPATDHAVVDSGRSPSKPQS
jgi:hypothetical protein